MFKFNFDLEDEDNAVSGTLTTPFGVEDHPQPQEQSARQQHEEIPLTYLVRPSPSAHNKKIKK